MADVNTFAKVTCVALLAVAARPAMADDVNIAVMTKNLTNPFFQAVRVGAEKAAKTANSAPITSGIGRGAGGSEARSAHGWQYPTTQQRTTG